jgi:hypothetical protein
MIYMANGAANAELLRSIGYLSAHEDESIGLDWRDVVRVEILVYVFRGGMNIQRRVRNRNQHDQLITGRPSIYFSLTH